LPSSSMARASARLMASTSVTSGIGTSAELCSLAGVAARQFGVEMVEHSLRRARRGPQITLDRRLDRFLALGRKLFLLRLAPHLLAHEIRAQARDRLPPPTRLAPFVGGVAPRVICSGVIAEPVRHGLDQVRPAV